MELLELRNKKIGGVVRGCSMYEILNDQCGRSAQVGEGEDAAGSGGNLGHTQAVCSTKSGDSQNEWTEDHEIGMGRETGNHTVLPHQGPMVGSE